MYTWQQGDQPQQIPVPPVGLDLAQQIIPHATTTSLSKDDGKMLPLKVEALEVLYEFP